MVSGRGSSADFAEKRSEAPLFEDPGQPTPDPRPATNSASSISLSLRRGFSAAQRASGHGGPRQGSPCARSPYFTSTVVATFLPSFASKDAVTSAPSFRVSMATPSPSQILVPSSSTKLFSLASTLLI